MFKKILIAILAITISAPIYPENINEKDRAIDCLAQNIYYEARGEPRAGKIAVAMVTMNRVKSKYYPNNVCSVVTQKVKSTCQFSWVCMKNIPRLRQELFNEIRTLARMVYNGEVKDNTRGATNFHSKEIVPEWIQYKRVTAEFGNHIFYRK